MDEASRDSSKAWEGFQAVSRDGEAQRQRLADATLAQGQKVFDIQVAWCSAIEFAKALRHRRADISLDDHISSGTDGGQCPDHGFAGRVPDDLLGPLLPVKLL